ncbi:sulfurtransferase TusA family protein [Shewanella mangrovisoli]|uniref:sulfurtransferase TusA family protein n=1 Tax=Shewanella mangrovisoli TaxID=2864211 RepID=UPI0035B6C03D
MIFIDLTSFRCPIPLVKVKLALKSVSAGDSLHILLSDPGSRRDVPAFFKKQGHSVVTLQDDASQLGLLITKVDLSQG